MTDNSWEMLFLQLYGDHLTPSCSSRRGQLPVSSVRATHGLMLPTDQLKRNTVERQTIFKTRLQLVRIYKSRREEEILFVDTCNSPYTYVTAAVASVGRTLHESCV